MNFKNKMSRIWNKNLDVIFLRDLSIIAVTLNEL